MAAPKQHGSESLFATAVRRVLDSWTVLQLAVSHGFGGAESREKADWMVFAVEQWFKENRNIESDEMEDFLADVMNAEFDTIVEDDSLPQIATLICGFHRLYSDGKEMEIRERLQHLPRAATAQSSRVNTGGDDNDDDSDDEKEDNPASASTSNQVSLHQRQPDGNPQSTIHNDQTQNPQCSQQTPSNENYSKEESMETEEEEGWQVVRKGKRR